MGEMKAIDRLAKGTRGYVLLFLLTFLTALPGIFTMPVLDRDEARFAQASKQMLETGDFITIRYQDGMRNKKPAGIHWLQSASTAVFSSAEAKQIWSYRIPSLLGAALATCAVMWAGIPLIGRRAAFLGAALFGSGVLLIFETNMSKTDCVLIAITTLGMGALIYLRNWMYKPRFMAILFWFCMGFGFLIKGPVTPMVAFLALAFVSLWQRRGIEKWPALLCAGIVVLFFDTYFYFGDADKWIGYGFKAVGSAMIGAAALRFVADEWKTDWFRHLFWWPGPLLWVVMVLPWFLWIQAATDGAFFKGAVGKDLKDKVVGASEGHGGMPGYHTLYLTLMFFPATLFLIPALTMAFRKVRGAMTLDRGVMFLLAWLIPTWFVFEFIPTKLPHYLLPAYPALALLCGYGAIKLAEGAKLPVSRIASLVWFLIGGIAFVVVFSPIGIGLLQAEALTDFERTPLDDVRTGWAAMDQPFILVAAFAVILIAVALTYFVRKYMIAIALSLLGIFLFSLHVRVQFFPSQNWAQATTQARTALSEVCGLPDQQRCATPPDLIQAYGYAEPSFVFTTGTDVKIYPESTLTLPPADEFPAAAWVINLEFVPPEDEQDPIGIIRQQAEAQNRCVRESSPHYAANYADGDSASFVAVRVDQGPCGG